MEINDFKKLSISNLILIILNNTYHDLERKCAEVELRKRIKHLGWDYNDLLHFDDKVINKRGLDIDNYLISENVNLQQLMEIYFTYCYDKDYEENGLLFSEKHLCNETNLGSPFFSKICMKEAKNMTSRIGHNVLEGREYKDLEKLRDILLLRDVRIEDEKKENRRVDLIESLCYNDALYQIDEEGILEFYTNVSDEEKYKLLSTRLGLLKLRTAELLNDTLFDGDALQYLYGLHFVRKDASKLEEQKRRLMSQVRSGYEVDYTTDAFRRVLHK